MLSFIHYFYSSISWREGIKYLQGGKGLNSYREERVKFIIIFHRGRSIFDLEVKV